MDFGNFKQYLFFYNIKSDHVALLQYCKVQKWSEDTWIPLCLPTKDIAHFDKEFMQQPTRGEYLANIVPHDFLNCNAFLQNNNIK